MIPGSNSSTVGSANDLNPFMLRDLRNIDGDPTKPPARLEPDAVLCAAARATPDPVPAAAPESPGPGTDPAQTWQCSQ